SRVTSIAGTHSRPKGRIRSPACTSSGFRKTEKRLVTRRRATSIERALVVRACKESSPKTSRLECCTARPAFRSFHPNSPFAPTLRPRSSGCPPPGQPGFFRDFKGLDGQWKAPESLGGCSAAAFSEVLFRQHPAENCIAECSKCLFVVACRSM